MIKYYAWELTFEDRLETLRSEEMQVLQKSEYRNAVSAFTWACAPFLVSFTVNTKIINNFNIIRATMGRHPTYYVKIVVCYNVQTYRANIEYTIAPVKSSKEFEYYTIRKVMYFFHKKTGLSKL